MRPVRKWGRLVSGLGFKLLNPQLAVEVAGIRAGHSVNSPGVFFTRRSGFRPLGFEISGLGAALSPTTPTRFTPSFFVFFVCVKVCVPHHAAAFISCVTVGLKFLSGVGVKVGFVPEPSRAYL